MANPIASSALPAGLAGGKAGAALAAYEIGNKLVNQMQELKRRHFAFTVSVSEADPLYSDIHAWLLDIMPTEKHRSLLVSSPGRGNYDGETVAADEDSSTDPEAKRLPLSVKFDDSSSRKVMIGGHKIVVWLSTPDSTAGATGNFERDPKKIKFQAYSYEGQQSVIKELNRINAEKATTRKASLKMVSSWGQWRTRSDLPPRTLESVAMPREQKERILKDLENFLAQEDRYNRLAIPWHRGYMFHGPPGTGKTSIVKALANHFNLDLWYIGLSDLTAEASLMNLLSQVGPRSILLLEDIDTVKITHDRDDSDSGKISAGSLLNALDGVATPHGLITMMTTNRFDILDEALVRAGRMDCIEELGWPTMDTLEQMFVHFYGRRPHEWGSSSDHKLKGISVSAVAEIFKSNMHDPENAAVETFKLTIDADAI